MSKPHFKGKIRFQFQHSRNFATSAFPSLLSGSGDRCQPLLVGYANKGGVVKVLSELYERGNYWPESVHINEK